LLHEKYHAVCHFCHEILSRPKVVTYLQELLAEEAFELRIMEGINRAYEGWKEDLVTARERILICNGHSCGRNHQNRPIIYYLLNKLFESNKAHLAKVELVNCLNSCGTGQNLYLERQNKLVQRVGLETIDYIVREIGHRRFSDNSSSL
jgi:NADH:ubiquinone oxidoreductase subunit E